MKKTLMRFIVAAILIASAFPTIPVSAGANQCTWTGGGAGNNWSTDANWACSVGTGPATGYDLIFPYLGDGEVPNNDLSAANVYSGIWFTGTIPAGCLYNTIYTLGGNDVQLAGDINVLTVDGCATVIIDNDVIITGDAIFDTSDASNTTRLDLNGTLTMGVNNLTVTAQSDYIGSVELGVINGSGAIIVSGNVALYGSSPSYTGTISITSGRLFAAVVDGLGNTSGSTTVGAGASLYLRGGCGIGGTASEDITFTGGKFDPGSLLVGKLGYDAGCGAVPGQTEVFNSPTWGSGLTFDGTITLLSSIDVEVLTDMTFTGTIDGSGQTMSIAYDAGSSSNWGSALTLSTVSNNTNTPDGVYVNPVVLTTLSDSQPSNTVYIGTNNEVTITGVRGDIQVNSGGVLKGDGTVGVLWAQGGILQPGLSPGILTTGNLLFDSATTVDIELEGTTPGASGHDQFDVTGTVTLGDAILNTMLFNGYAPANIGDSYTIINNDGADAVVGTFVGLSEGGTFSVGAYQFDITYVGGDGNDVALSVTYVPGPPGTGFGTASSSILIPATAILLGLGVIVFMQTKIKKVKSIKNKS